MERPKVKLDRSQWGDMLDMVNVEAVDEWDTETEREAMSEAQRISERDPEAAAFLMAHVAVSQEKRKEAAQYEPYEEEYNPTRLYAQMTKYYRISPKELDEMHYLLFFGYLREANRMNEEEERQVQGYMQRHNVPRQVQVVD